MKGYTIQHSIELLEKNQGGGSGGSTTAENVSYSNTSSGLTADNVQEAIDELKTDIPTIADYGMKISTTETLIGKWGNDDLYQKIITGEIGKSDSVTIDFADGVLKNIYGYFTNSLNNINFPLNANWSATVEGALFDDSHIYLNSSASIGADSSYTIIAQYIKTAPVSNTRKKSSK